LPYNPARARKRETIGVVDDWQMPRAERGCRSCAHEFAAGEAFRAFLYDCAAAAGFERHDYCLNCSPPAEPRPLGAWKTRRAVPAQKQRAFDRAAMYGFFQGLEDADQPERLQLRFVLALLLWRKRVLKFVNTESAGEVEHWDFVATGTGQAHRVRRPDLDEAQLERLSAQLEQLLAGEGVPDAGPVAPAEEATRE
jgi:hypothetical protein